jgi:hypothetical protein
MKELSKAKANIIGELKRCVTELWQSINEATRKQDTTKVKRITAHIERLESMVADVERTFNELELVNVDAPRPVPTPQRGTTKTPKAVPRTVRINSYVEGIKKLNEIPMVVANWIEDQGIDIPEMHNFVQRDVRKFSDSGNAKRLKSGKLIEVGDDKRTLVKKARRLLDECGFSSSVLQVELENGEVIKA